MSYIVKNICGCIIMLGSFGKVLRGKYSDDNPTAESSFNTQTVNEEQWKELNGLIKEKLISVEEDHTEQKLINNEKKPKDCKKNKIRRTKNQENTNKEESVVFTPNGMVKTKSTKSSDLYEDEELFKESILAAKKLDEERANEDHILDENKLDLSERMGNEAVVSNGRNKTQRVKSKGVSSDNQIINWVDESHCETKSDKNSNIDEYTNGIFVDDPLNDNQNDDTDFVNI